MFGAVERVVVEHFDERKGSIGRRCFECSGRSALYRYKRHISEVATRSVKQGQVYDDKGLELGPVLTLIPEVGMSGSWESSEQTRDCFTWVTCVVSQFPTCQPL
jgi:hypothetical protein